MNKKEFLSLYKSIKDCMKRNVRQIDDEKKDIHTRARAISRDIIDEAAKETRKNLQKIIENQEPEIRIENVPVYHVEVPERIEAIIQYSAPVTIEPGSRLESLIKKLEQLAKRREELYHLSTGYREILLRWKLRAIENKTYNKEPFPAELWPYLCDELKEFLTVKKEDGE